MTPTWIQRLRAFFARFREPARTIREPGQWVNYFPGSNKDAMEMLNFVNQWYEQGFRTLVWNCPAGRPTGIVPPFWQIPVGDHRDRFVDVVVHVNRMYPKMRQVVYIGGSHDEEGDVTFARLLLQAMWFKGLGINTVIMDAMSGLPKHRAQILLWEPQLRMRGVTLGTENFAHSGGGQGFCCVPRPEFNPITQLMLQARQDHTAGLRQLDDSTQYNHGRPYDLHRLREAFVIVWHTDNPKELRSWAQKGALLLGSGGDTDQAVLDATR